MGWKSTIDISVSKAKELIGIAEAYHDNSPDDIDKLEMRLHELGVGDNPDLPYYGHNFCIFPDEEKD